MVAAAVVSAPASQAAPAPARAPVTCGGTRCDNKDPANTGCDAGARTVDSVRTSKGTFDLRYSTACRTNWVRVTNYAGGSTRPDRKLELTVWTRRATVRFHASASAGSHWGNMIYSPGSECAQGGADWNGGSSFDAHLKSSGC